MTIQQRAIRLVQRAMDRGELERLPDGRQCADCDRMASVWDHREYAKPLDVVAVCQRCNAKRGWAIDWSPWNRKPEKKLQRRIVRLSPDWYQRQRCPTYLPEKSTTDSTESTDLSTDNKK